MNSPTPFCFVKQAVTAFILCAGLAACSEGIDNARLRVDVIEEQTQPFAIGGLPLGEGSAQLRLATAQGLVAFDRDGRVAPALAARWIITDDGLSFIFRLNKTKWNNGKEVTSEAVVNALNSRLAQLKRSRLSGELNAIDRAVSMTGKVVEIRLKSPMPNLIELLAQPELGIVQEGAGTGPMQAKKYRDVMVLQNRGLDEKGNIKLEDAQLSLRSSKAPQAVALFRDTKSDLVMGGRFQHYPYIEAASIPAEQIQFDPTPGLFGLRIESSGPFLSSAQNREAIAMAIDRPKMLASFDLVAWQEMLTLVPETMRNRLPVARPEWAKLQVVERQQRAKAIIAGWTASKGAVRPLQIAMPEGPGARMLFARLRADMKAIGLDAQRVVSGKEADLRLIDKVADLSSPLWYLAQLSCQQTDVCDQAADELVAQAAASGDPAERARLFGAAETKLQEKRNFIPLASPMRWSLAREGLLGYAPNPRGWHLLHYLGHDTK